MRPATFKEGLRSNVQFMLVYVGVEAFVWVGAFLVALGCVFSVYLGLAVFICWALAPALLLRRELKLDIKALDDPNDNPRANRLIGNTYPSASIREESDAGRPAAPNRMTRALGALEYIALRFAVELLKFLAIIIALPLGMGFAAEIIAFALSDRDVSGAFGSGLAGVAGGALGLVLAVVIVLGRIADIED
ncbi:hypothetical protein ACVIGB_002856 [Bradyrhizobium sp. USDA 4341]